MIWIVVAIVVAGWLIALAISKANANSTELTRQQIINSPEYQKKILVTEKYNEMFDEVTSILLSGYMEQIKILKNAALDKRQKITMLKELDADILAKGDAARAKQESLQEKMGVLPDHEGYESPFKNDLADVTRERRALANQQGINV
jgi:hypothetical protein